MKVDYPWKRIQSHFFKWKSLWKVKIIYNYWQIFQKEKFYRLIRTVKLTLHLFTINRCTYDNPFDRPTLCIHIIVVFVVLLWKFLDLRYHYQFLPLHLHFLAKILELPPQGKFLKTASQILILYRKNYFFLKVRTNTGRNWQLRKWLAFRY